MSEPSPSPAEIADEDRRFHEAFISQTAGLADTPFVKLAELLAGGSGTGPLLLL